MPPPMADRDCIALGIRQPWAELILRGHKTIEVRTQPTARRGVIYLYASRTRSDHPEALAAAAAHGIDIESLPAGVLVGQVEIIGSNPCTPADGADACLPPALLKGRHGWRLKNPRRLSEPLPVRFLPYGIWFYPFKRLNGGNR